MSQNLQNVARFQKFQLDNLVDFEKCCKTRIFLQKLVPIQPKTSNILPKFFQKLATTLRVRRARNLDGRHLARNLRPRACRRLLRHRCARNPPTIDVRLEICKHLHSNLLQNKYSTQKCRMSDFCSLYCDCRN